MKTSTTRPITLSLTFETESELNLFRYNLMGYNLTIPQTLYEKEYITSEQRNEIETMMRQIYGSLQNPL